ncbi:hypothetical protein GEMRC1_010194 [Eukaryota sp. GEM-RC1]
MRSKFLNPDFISVFYDSGSKAAADVQHQVEQISEHISLYFSKIFEFLEQYVLECPLLSMISNVDLMAMNFSKKFKDLNNLLSVLFPSVDFKFSNFSEISTDPESFEIFEILGFSDWDFSTSVVVADSASDLISTLDSLVTSTFRSNLLKTFEDYSEESRPKWIKKSNFYCIFVVEMLNISKKVSHVISTCLYDPHVINDTISGLLININELVLLFRENKSDLLCSLILMNSEAIQFLRDSQKVIDTSDNLCTKLIGADSRLLLKFDHQSHGFSIGHATQNFKFSFNYSNELLVPPHLLVDDQFLDNLVNEWAAESIVNIYLTSDRVIPSQIFKIFKSLSFLFGCKVFFLDCMSIDHSFLTRLITNISKLPVWIVLSNVKYHDILNFKFNSNQQHPIFGLFILSAESQSNSIDFSLDHLHPWSTVIKPFINCLFDLNPEKTSDYSCDIDRFLNDQKFKICLTVMNIWYK